MDERRFPELIKELYRLMGELVERKPLPSNGMYQVQLSRLAVLMNKLPEQDRIPPVALPRSSGT